MELTTVLEVVGGILSIGMVAAAVVGVVLFAKYKGTITALQETVTTYADLNEALKTEREEMKRRMDEQDRRITELEKMLEIERSAVSIAVGETLKALNNAIVCPACGAKMADVGEKNG